MHEIVTAPVFQTKKLIFVFFLQGWLNNSASKVYVQKAGNHIVGSSKDLLDIFSFARKTWNVALL